MNLQYRDNGIRTRFCWWRSYLLLVGLSELLQDLSELDGLILLFKLQQLNLLVQHQLLLFVLVACLGFSVLLRGYQLLSHLVENYWKFLPDGRLICNFAAKFIIRSNDRCYLVPLECIVPRHVPTTIQAVQEGRFDGRRTKQATFNLELSKIRILLTVKFSMWCDYWINISCLRILLLMERKSLSGTDFGDFALPVNDVLLLDRIFVESTTVTKDAFIRVEHTPCLQLVLLVLQVDNELVILTDRMFQIRRCPE